MNMEMEKYYKKLKNYYGEDGLLKQFPSKKPIRIIALANIVNKFEEEKNYTEKQVNEIILENISFSDFELIRRELFEYKMVNRLRDGSKYWVEPNWKERYSEYL